VSDLLDRDTILRAFGKLDSELARRQVRADVFVVGGAAIALAFDTARRTRDVDAVFTNAGVVYEAARTVARRMGLPADWLNDAVRTYVLGEDADATVTYESESLQVSVASAPYVLAMKLLAARAEFDTADIRLLYAALGMTSRDDGLTLLSRYLGDRPVPDATIDLLEAMFGSADAPTASRAATAPVTGPRAVTCRRCGRVLKSPASIAAGIGPICASR
jgi:hypothetical protein